MTLGRPLPWGNPLGGLWCRGDGELSHYRVRDRRESAGQSHRSHGEDWPERGRLANGKYRDAMEFVESIPFTETREYVQSVLRNATVYKRLYGTP